MPVYVPVTVIVAVPTAAEPLTVIINVLGEAGVAGLGLNDAFTPDGSPEATRATLPENPPVGTTVSVLIPQPPSAIFKVAGAAVRVKFPTD